MLLAPEITLLSSVENVKELDPILLVNVVPFGIITEATLPSVWIVNVTVALADLKDLGV